MPEYSTNYEGSVVRATVHGEDGAEKLEIYLGDSQKPVFTYDTRKKVYEPKATRMQTASILCRISAEDVPEEVVKNCASAALQTILQSEPVITN
jgi:hypothetical protein